MKHCTIIYDTPDLARLFGLASDDAARVFAAECADEMMEAAEQVARNFGYDHESIRWSGAAARPPRIGLLCGEALAQTLRDRLRHRYIVELDTPGPEPLKYRL